MTDRRKQERLIERANWALRVLYEVVEALTTNGALPEPRRRKLLVPLRLALTPRQREVLVGVADGLTIEAIASKLGISESTVKHHLRDVRERLDVRSAAQAVATAYQLGILRPQDAELAEPQGSGDGA